MEDAVQIMDTEACSMKVPCQGFKSPDVTERELSRHSDKIPPVKPCFKKKHSPKMFDAETLNALRPIFTSFLGSGPLNGIFVPRNQTGDVTNLCEPHVKKGIKTEQQCPQPTTLISGDQSVGPVVDNSLSLHSGQEDLGGETPSVIETSEPTFPSEQNSSVTAAHTSNESFQDPILQANPEDSTSSVCLDKIIENYSNGLFQDSSCLDQYSLNQDNTNTGIFQDKTEEASLLLVFELLNQLQYHVHQNDGIDICVEFLQGLCFYGNDCLKHHTVLPYHWQVRRIDTGLWQSINDDSQEHLERLYCSPDSDRIKMRYQGHDFLADLNCMNVDSLEFDQIRRLSTPSTSSVASNYHTVWKYFCRDHFGWREYSEPVVKLIEEANCRGLKEVRFVTWHNQYILNIKDGFQQNACFRKEIKRRPLFRSSVMLLPHLQTLSGTTPLTTPAIDSASQVLSPVAITFPNFYPETWIPMDSSQEFVQVPMTNEDKSFRTVYSLFHKTVPETKFRISKIMRVQNLFLWEKYKRKKEFMTRKMTGLDKIMNERHLFHGTSQDVVDGICKHNFDPRVCGKHATMFGQGSYFARKASYSHNFSKRSQKGVHYMFLAKVLTGRYIVGNPTMRRPPPLNPGNITSDLYDSCVDNYFEPQIFVIFNDDQSYPYFIIQYEEVSNTVHI
ncbi:protein mono-ADP-ribosyltransferase TIPARP [Spea bombifrons]|uniref:protein mono-ADP-ribosyltransferase TIPARP n=1 Tax=Spea bombifrons TaxID=233779 RepID=UPI00234B783B|nr:protein mono-ADP-ribosyltransferase TIPARP [Spea bombifrons]XP_053315302.1 protein mono-ADP-ribosyltransferase TIPARP [Spea bombifrons]